MRKIETKMLNAIRKQESWCYGNTHVSFNGSDNCAVFLHGNHIADVCCLSSSVKPNEYTLCKWPTRTTKSRLRALGVKVTTKKGATYIDGKMVTA